MDCDLNRRKLAGRASERVVVRWNHRSRRLTHCSKHVTDGQISNLYEQVLKVCTYLVVDFGWTVESCSLAVAEHL